MGSENNMAAAREAAALAFDARARKSAHPATIAMERHHAKVIRQGEGDDYDAVQAALIAIERLAQPDAQQGAPGLDVDGICNDHAVWDCKECTVGLATPPSPAQHGEDCVAVPRAVLREMRLAEKDYADAKSNAVDRLAPAIDAVLAYEKASRLATPSSDAQQGEEEDPETAFKRDMAEEARNYFGAATPSSPALDAEQGTKDTETLTGADPARRYPSASSPALDAATIERCAAIVRRIGEVAGRQKDHVSPLPCDTNEAWRRVEDATLDILEAFDALPNAEKRHG